MKPEFEVGVIGGGVAVSMALPALATFKSVAISYKDSPYKDKFSKFTFFDDPNAFFQKDKVGCLYIATPVNLHKDFLLKAATSRIPVLVEKPLCLDIAQCEEIAFLESSKIAVAFRKRFSQMAKQIRSIRNTNTETVCSIEYIWLAPHPGANHWKLTRAIAGGGVIMDIGSHVLDFLEHCVGRVDSMEVHHVEFDKRHLTKSLVRFSCTFKDGSRGGVLIGWAEDEAIQKLDFREGNKSVCWIKHGGNSLSQLTSINGRSSKTSNCERSEDYFAMFHQFRAFSKGGRNSAPSLNDGIRNMYMMSDLYNLLCTKAGATRANQ